MTVYITLTLLVNYKIHKHNHQRKSILWIVNHTPMEACVNRQMDRVGIQVNLPRVMTLFPKTLLLRQLILPLSHQPITIMTMCLIILSNLPTNRKQQIELLPPTTTKTTTLMEFSNFLDECNSPGCRYHVLFGLVISLLVGCCVS